MTTYAIVDLSNMIQRSRHAVVGDPFLKAGMAMHIFFRSLRKVVREFGANHIVACADAGSWRTKVYPLYKAKRKLDRSLKSQDDIEEDQVFHKVTDDLIEFLRTKTRLTVLNERGIEADDFVAAWIRRHPDDKHIIISCDSDFVQLIAPNVSIYDGITERLITTDKVVGPKGEELEFEVNTTNGRIKVKGKAPDDFVPEPDWWRHALFVKIIRGDDGDGIFSCNPGVRYNGSTKRVGIREAWEDRRDKGFLWNNFFQQDWEKLDGFDAATGEKIVRRVRVLDEYRLNETLIDLTKQPGDVQDLMNRSIDEAISKEPPVAVGIEFARFCKKNDLPELAKEASSHVSYLNEKYPGAS